MAWANGAREGTPPPALWPLLYQGLDQSVRGPLPCAHLPCWSCHTSAGLRARPLVHTQEWPLLLGERERPCGCCSGRVEATKANVPWWDNEAQNESCRATPTGSVCPWGQARQSGHGDGPSRIKAKSSAMGGAALAVGSSGHLDTAWRCGSPATTTLAH